MSKSKPRPADDAPASKEEITREIEALTIAQLVHLDQIAWFRHRSLGTRVFRTRRGTLCDAE